jgi:hypothetical protein
MGECGQGVDVTSSMQELECLEARTEKLRGTPDCNVNPVRVVAVLDSWYHRKGW